MLQFKNLKQVITTFSDEQVCRDFLVQQRWNGSPVCLYCGSNKWYSIEDRKRFKCGDKDCYKKYSVTVGTMFSCMQMFRLQHGFLLCILIHIS